MPIYGCFTLTLKLFKYRSICVRDGNINLLFLNNILFDF